MNRLPLILAEIARRGAGGVGPYIFIAAGVVLVAVIGGALIVKSIRKSSKGGGEGRVDRRSPQNTDLGDHYKNSGRVDNFDFEIISRLPDELKAIFPDGLSESFSIARGWLFDNVLASRLEGDERAFDRLLENLISKSNGAYKAAARIGERFNCDYMHTRCEMPDDLKITKIYQRGLIRVSTGEVLVDAEVA